MDQKIHLINQIDLNKIIYSKVNEMNDKKLIHIYYEKPGNKLLFQTPQLLNIFDIQKSQYFNELILPLYDCNLKVPLFIQLLKDLDSKIIEGAKQNKNEWFKNKASIRYKSLIKNLYTSNSQSNYYTPSKEDEKYSENGLIKLKITNGVKIVENGSDIKIDQLQKNSNIRLIVELYGVWVSKDVFGIYLKPVMVEQIENKVIKFIDEKEDITEVNYLETEANSDDEYIGDHEMVLAKGKSNKKVDSTEDSGLANDNINLPNEKMYHFGLHDINEDFINKLKQDNNIVNVLTKLNSNNTKTDLTLSEMSSEIDDEALNIKKNTKNNTKQNAKKNKQNMKNDIADLLKTDEEEENQAAVNQEEAEVNQEEVNEEANEEANEEKVNEEEVNEEEVNEEEVNEDEANEDEESDSDNDENTEEDDEEEYDDDEEGSFDDYEESEEEGSEDEENIKGSDTSEEAKPAPVVKTQTKTK